MLICIQRRFDFSFLPLPLSIIFPRPNIGAVSISAVISMAWWPGQSLKTHDTVTEFGETSVSSESVALAKMVFSLDLHINNMSQLIKVESFFIDVKVFCKQPYVPCMLPPPFWCYLNNPDLTPKWWAWCVYLCTHRREWGHCLPPTHCSYSPRGSVML